MNALAEVSLVVVSDVHLKTLEDDRGRCFTTFLEHLLEQARRLEYLVFNGDVFDLFLGNALFFSDKYGPLLPLLEGFSTRGVKVLFVEGNHEFFLEALPWTSVDVRTDPVVQISCEGTPFLFLHGDRLDPPWLYSLFRRVVRSFPVRWVTAFLVPGSWIEALGVYLSQRSRRKDPYRILNHQKIISGLRALARSVPGAHVVVGHFHYPYCEPVDASLSSSPWIRGLPSWEEAPNALGWSLDSGFTLLSPSMD